MNLSNEDHAWTEYNIGRALAYKGEWEETRKYYDRAYDRMVKPEPPRTKDSFLVLHNIGVILYQQRKYDNALEYYLTVLKIKKGFYRSGHIDIAKSLHNIGNVL
ncbi:unnamed protein product [Rotaria magnacalcarata]|uniref:Tetratricopeptide repeat protein n=1 Tax=Rotaria magnacalcarata TaxID=392030 RepID=A0A816QQW2_9BILA|nr:unnamed protein product [Rotaria magnacalcarata]CAF2065127.1 unnamed protein product [Rotaria magnacalcarata]